MGLSSGLQHVKKSLLKQIPDLFTGGVFLHIFTLSEHK